ncbi:MAG: hypothetical protein IJ803_06055 [Oribacterium sp.]|nr:hypothetical protein [Oribacterium sp.]
MSKKEMIERTVRIRSEIVMLCQVLPAPLDAVIELLIPIFDELLEKLRELE